MYLQIELMVGECQLLKVMACEVPAAAIDWSRGTQFLNSNNGYPIPTTGHLELYDTRLVDHEDSYNGQHWAQATTSALRSTLRFSLEDPQTFFEGTKSIRDHQISFI